MFDVMGVGGVVGVGEVEALRGVFGELVARLDPGSVALPDAPVVFGLLDEVERLAAGAKLMLAARVEQSGVWRRDGYPSAVDYLAATTKTTVGRARESLKTSARVHQQPGTCEALRNGELNADQANAVSDATAAAPEAEGELLGIARREGLNELRNRCERAKAGADADPEARRGRIHAERRARSFTGADGSWNLEARGTREDGARVEAALRPLLEDIFNEARRAGERVTHEAQFFDALVRFCTATGAAGDARETGRVRHRYLTLVRADITALLRGKVHGGEVCEIAGVGPISVPGLRSLLGESIVELVITRGTDVLNVTHLGRGPTAAQKVALLWAQPMCAREGCNRSIVEADHREDFARTRHTRLDELDHLCKPDHALKTHQGWALVAGTGRRPLVPPQDPRHPRHTHGDSDPPTCSPLTPPDRAAVWGAGFNAHNT